MSNFLFNKINKFIFLFFLMAFFYWLTSFFFVGNTRFLWFRERGFELEKVEICPRKSVEVYQVREVKNDPSFTLSYKQGNAQGVCGRVIEANDSDNALTIFWAEYLKFNAVNTSDYDHFRLDIIKEFLDVKDLKKLDERLLDNQEGGWHRNVSLYQYSSEGYSWELVSDFAIKPLGDGIIFQFQLMPKRVWEAGFRKNANVDDLGKAVINGRLVMQRLFEENLHLNGSS
ncbi:hypothetical protein GOZ80_03065 [Agrobacterium vitis]|uniref:F5/8 type C domain-containing protein n=1 Tax=Agrobacterium vitis TaxID=373 RepID=A0ABD6G4V1_AGRVI|nr:hypothetical protein [Agrobacterium vitis]MUO80212.1 hypothetical protein [Agrobacterium vitis]MUO97154.1 hypothetical protein [Agrobacterium vitis]MUP03670.1 hypothetical protein [Agrobacterium vitis]MUZ82648.1 hypothetical protein [Agrobacterium vitis]MVA91009.1 hypothetical protein [Agrobacterium vitis]